METAKTSVIAKGGMNRLSTEEFQGSESILYHAIMMYTHNYIFV